MTSKLRLFLASLAAVAATITAPAAASPAVAYPCEGSYTISHVYGVAQVTGWHRCGTGAWQPSYLVLFRNKGGTDLNYVASGMGVANYTCLNNTDTWTYFMGGQIVTGQTFTMHNILCG